MASKPNSAVIASRISEAVEQTALINDMIRALQAKSQALMDECWEFTKDAAPTEDLARTLFDSVRAIEEHRTQTDVSEEARNRFRDLLAGDAVLKECLRAGNASTPGATEAKVAPEAATSLLSAAPAASPATGAPEVQVPEQPAKTAEAPSDGGKTPRRVAIPRETSTSKPPARRAALVPAAASGKSVPPAITEGDVDAVRHDERRGHAVEDAVFDDFVVTSRADVYSVAGISPYLAKDGGAGLVFEIAVYSYRNGLPDPFEDSGGVKKWRKKLSAVVYERLSKLVGRADASAVTPTVAPPATEPVPDVSASLAPVDEEASSTPTEAAAVGPPVQPDDRVQVAAEPPASPPAAAARATPVVPPHVRRPVPPRPALPASSGPPAEDRGQGAQRALVDAPLDAKASTPKDPEPVRETARAAEPREHGLPPPVRRGPVFGAPPVFKDARPQPSSTPPVPDDDDASFGDEDGLPSGEAVPIELIAAQAASQSGRPRPAARGKPPPDPFE